MFTVILAIAALSIGASQPPSTIHPQVEHVRHHHRIKWRHPMNNIAKIHHWDQQEVQDAWTILYAESRSVPGHINIAAYNAQSGCAGAAQFASWQQYYTYGGNPWTIKGQMKAFGNYITQRYGNPANALAFHEANGWY